MGLPGSRGLVTRNELCELSIARTNGWSINSFGIVLTHRGSICRFRTSFSGKDGWSFSSTSIRLTTILCFCCNRQRRVCCMVENTTVVRCTLSVLRVFCAHRSSGSFVLCAMSYGIFTERIKSDTFQSTSPNSYYLSEEISPREEDRNFIRF